MVMDVERLLAPEAQVDEDAVAQELGRYIRNEDDPDDWEPWRITSLGQADWAVRQVAAIQAKAGEYDDEVALWREAKRRAVASAEWFEERLAEWAVAQREASGGRVKTQQLAHGAVETRASKPRVEVEDEAAVIEWARKQCPAAVKVTESFAKSEAIRGGQLNIRDVCVGYRAIDTESGRIEEIEAEPLFDDGARTGAFEANLHATVGPHILVERITEPMVVDAGGDVVPGVVVVGERVSATVRSFGL